MEECNLHAINKVNEGGRLLITTSSPQAGSLVGVTLPPQRLLGRMFGFLDPLGVEAPTPLDNVSSAYSYSSMVGQGENPNKSHGALERNPAARVDDGRIECLKTDSSLVGGLPEANWPAVGGELAEMASWFDFSFVTPASC